MSCVRAKISGNHFDASQCLIHGKELSNQSRRARRDVGGRDTRVLSGGCHNRRGVLVSLFAVAGIRVAGVINDGLNSAIRHCFAGKLHGRGHHAVAREDRSGVEIRTLVNHEGHVGFSGGLDSGCRGASEESCRGGNHVEFLLVRVEVS